MQTIFASKLYQASTRKDRINAALIAPGNLQLVQQLADSLDEKYQTPENLDPEYKEKKAEKEKEKESEGFDELIVDEEIDPSKDLVTIDDLGESSKGKKSAPKSSSHSAPKPSSGPTSEPKEDKPEKADTSDLMPESPANEIESTAASTKIQSSTIADLNTLKATLNSREDTAGVVRIAEKENEVWIYYNDDTNLNNVMTEVIECLMDTECCNFEFNRLARSDNAIVFLREISTTSEEPKEG